MSVLTDPLHVLCKITSHIKTVKGLQKLKKLTESRK